jgi:hypothetical protein
VVPVINCASGGTHLGLLFLIWMALQILGAASQVISMLGPGCR